MKQGTYVWNQRLKTELLDMGFTQCEKDKCIFILVIENGIIIIAIFVNDLIFFFNCMELLLSVKERLFKTFSMKDLGDVKKCFELNVVRDRVYRIITLDREEFIHSILKTSEWIIVKSALLLWKRVLKHH